VLVPEALAYATIAGVSPVVELYAAPPALLLYAAFGSSRHLVVGPMSVTAALSAVAVADVARDPNAAAVPGVVVLRPESGPLLRQRHAIQARVLDQVERTGASAVVLDAQTVPSIDVTAVRMLDALADDLERRGVRFAVARDVGQVRDLLAHVRSDSPVRTYPTVRAAVTALTRGQWGVR
jgi:MFS superfamily sulfate permease-like transporter